MHISETLSILLLYESYFIFSHSIILNIFSNISVCEERERALKQFLFIHLIRFSVEQDGNVINVLNVILNVFVCVCVCVLKRDSVLVPHLHHRGNLAATPDFVARKKERKRRWENTVRGTSSL